MNDQKSEPTQDECDIEVTMSEPILSVIEEIAVGTEENVGFDPYNTGCYKAG